MIDRIKIALFCLESKIRHSTICGPQTVKAFLFCLESKIRHSTIVQHERIREFMFCLESKIRHSTIRYCALFLCSATYKKIRRPIFLPEEHLLRQGNLLSGTRPAMKNEHLIPLDIRNEKTADRTIRRYHFLDSAGVGSHSFLSNARAGIDAILNHRIAVF